MANPATFDIIRTSRVVWGTRRFHVEARRIAALDSTFALLSWLRHEFGLKVDPLDLFDGTPHTCTAQCGCVYTIQFEAERRAWFNRMKSGEQNIVGADVESDPCATHERLNWTYFALPHDADRADEYSAA